MPIRGLKILVSADIHLGMKYGAYEEVQSELSNARFDTLHRLIESANREHCDLFIIAGDLFDRISVSKGDIGRAFEILGEFTGNALVVLPGNHDFITDEKTPPWSELYGDAARAADVIQLAAEKKIYSLKEHFDLPVRIYAGPCNAKHSGDNSISWIREAEKNPNELNIGVAHGSVEGLSPDFSQSYFPMNKAEIERCGLDIFVVGHTHIKYPQSPEASGTLFIPGTPEPDGFDCSHGGTAWLLEIDERKQLDSRVLDTGSFKFETHTYEVNSEADIEVLRRKFRTDGNSKLLMKIKLRGMLQRDAYSAAIQFVDELKQSILFVKEDISELSEEITLQMVKEEFADGSFPFELLSSLIEDGDRPAVQTAYRMIQDMRR
jgi:DNA repair protein SbcD/Mre11